MKKILIWTDSASVATGYGTVARNIFKALQFTGDFEIKHVAINYSGTEYSEKDVPWEMIPAIDKEKSDLFGRKTFLDVLKNGQFDLVWLMNDYQIVHPIIAELTAYKQERGKQGIPLKAIYYCPIDIEMPTLKTSYFDVFDKVVAYCDFGRDQILKLASHITEKLSVINLGIESSHMKLISNDERRKARKKFFNIDSDRTFLVINVNRNTYRKNIAASIRAFSEFKKAVPDSRLYLHTVMHDRASDIDLELALNVLGLSPVNDVIYPIGLNLLEAFSSDELKTIYNSADCFLTTSLGEGWGLTHIDAMAVNVPVVAPNNTSFVEQLGGGLRGFLYPCLEKIWLDNAGFRPLARQEDIVSSMHEAHRYITEADSSGTERSKLPKIAEARKYSESLSWEKISQEWVNLIYSTLG